MRPALLVICSLFAVGGCAQWSNPTWSASSTQDDASKRVLPTLARRPDSVVVDTVVLRFPAHSDQELDAIWQTADETIIDLVGRQKLGRNGLRAGLLVGTLPKLIRDALNTSGDGVDDILEDTDLASDSDNLSRKLQCRAGRRKELQIRRESNRPVHVLTTLDGEHISGETYQKAAMIFDLRAIPHGNGQATIRLTPEIQHGEVRQTFVRSDFGVRPELRRDQRVWKELAIDVRLQRGHVLLVAGTQPSKSLGQAFFQTETADHSTERTILLVRLAETQLDELFAPELVEQARILAEQ